MCCIWESETSFVPHVQELSKKISSHRNTAAPKTREGSSSTMEINIIAECFLTSMQTYGVKYHQVIADGDRNVYKTILGANPYDTLTVEKIECKNLLLRNFCNKLKDPTRNAKLKHINLRKEIGI
ncbi:hypothetical protein JTE90_006298 [Oedothorax gibbosus]|uniref:Mutator-like transposase domain-containing protein n=1 Tax=Oedothorax gibbosus TaxID=931172 RepID=A0AAV6U2I9_9ARAC|nr:hypothetical protein JTE90_006298 [Oedothorax gibbosus]